MLSLLYKQPVSTHQLSFLTGTVSEGTPPTGKGDWHCETRKRNAILLSEQHNLNQTSFGFPVRRACSHLDLCGCPVSETFCVPLFQGQSFTMSSDISSSQTSSLTTTAPNSKLRCSPTPSNHGSPPTAACLFLGFMFKHLITMTATSKYGSTLNTHI